MSEARYSPKLHRLAVLTAAATFPLIFMGGLVTSHHAGMSVPDWPNSYGYNMFTFPISMWKGGIFYEHTHRLMGSLVGLFAIALAIAAWKLESRRWVRNLAYAFLVAVIVQGVLGGLRVDLVNLTLAIVHGCFAQVCFCLAAIIVVVTSKWWHRAPDLSQSTNGKAGRRLVALSIACLAVVFAQLIVGAVMRHENAGLAIPDLPLAYGKLVPPTSDAGLHAINQERAFDYQMDPVSMAQIWVHFAHRIGAIVVSILVTVLCIMALMRNRDGGNRHAGAFLAPACVLALLLMAQATLGVLTVLMRKPADIASAHVATGALLLVTAVVIVARSMRMYSLAWREADEPIVHSAFENIRKPATSGLLTA